MSHLHRAAVCILQACLLAVLAIPAQAQAADFAPFESGERLVYRLLWPSGIPHGEAIFEVSLQGDDLRFQAAVEASLPQYRFSGLFSAVATRNGLCSRQFHQKIQEGSKTTEKSLEFDQAARQVRRIQDRDSTTAVVPECARDPLTFLYYVRSRMAEGQPVDWDSMHYDRQIALRLGQGESGTLSLGGLSRQGEKFVIRFPTRGGERALEVWFSTDAARTPLQFTVPTTLADFKAELE